MRILILLTCLWQTMLKVQCLAVWVFDLDKDQIDLFMDQNTNTALFFLHLAVRLNSIVQSIAKEGVYVYGIHKKEEFAIDDPMHADAVFLTDQTLFRQDGIEDRIAGM